MERAAFLIEDTNQRLECLLNPESLVVRRVAGVRDRLSDNLSEVEALWEMVMEVGAQNQILQTADLELQPQA